MASRGDPVEIADSAASRRVVELEAELEDLREEVDRLEARLAATERERDAAREWATFLEREVRTYRERAERRRGLLSWLRRLVG